LTFASNIRSEARNTRDVFEVTGLIDLFCLKIRKDTMTQMLDAESKTKISKERQATE